MKEKRAKRIAQAGILILSLLTPFLPIQVSQCFAAQKSDAPFEQQLAAEGFPESYKEKLRELHTKYPNWVFKAQKTGLSWQEAVQEESKIGRNLVHTSSRDSWKSKDSAAYNAATNSWKGFDTNAWVAANTNIVSYYMDPRNFLDSRYIFQFQTQGYDPDSQNAEGVRMLAANSFLSGISLSSGQSAGSTQVASAKGKSPSAVTWTAPGTPRDSGKAEVGEAPLSTEEQQRKTAASAAQPTVMTRGETDSTQKERAAIGILAGAPHDKLAKTEGGSLEAETTAAVGSAEEQITPENTEEVTAMEAVEPYQLLEEDAENQQFAGDVQAVIRRGATGAVSSAGTTANQNSGTLSGDGSGSNPSGVDYIATIMAAASSSGVNPYVLTAMLIQEQGRAGGSGLISGKNPKFPGFYNFFNAQAFQDGDKTPTERGLWWASQVDATYGKPWDTPEKSIIGGAKYYSDNYLKSGQDTFYLKKFNVTAKARYEHQYMTNVQAAAEEGRKLGEAYTEALKQKKHTFRIPVYTDMPESAAALPD